MATKRLFLAFIACLIILASAGLAYAQTTAASTTNLADWELLLEYLFLGAIFGVVHDINDKTGVILIPTKNKDGSWDLGILSPALLGAAAGFISQYVTTVPILSGMFPTLGTYAPGLVAAAFGGYFYAKLFASISSVITINSSSSASTQPKTPP